MQNQKMISDDNEFMEEYTVYDPLAIQATLRGIDTVDLSKALKYADKDLKKAVLNGLIGTTQKYIKKEMRKLKISQEDSKEHLNQFLQKLELTDQAIKEGRLGGWVPIEWPDLVEKYESLTGKKI
jgi:hypothetical protein